jgi:hypothetical protein
MIAQQRCAWKYPSYGNAREAAKSFSAQMAQRDRPPEAILGPPDYFMWGMAIDYFSWRPVCWCNAEASMHGSAPQI